MDSSGTYSMVSQPSSTETCKPAERSTATPRRPEGPSQARKIFWQMRLTALACAPCRASEQARGASQSPGSRRTFQSHLSPSASPGTWTTDEIARDLTLFPKMVQLTAGQSSPGRQSQRGKQCCELRSTATHRSRDQDISPHCMRPTRRTKHADRRSCPRRCRA